MRLGLGDEGAIGAWGSFCPRKTVTSCKDTRDTQPLSVNGLHGHLVRHKVTKSWIGNPISIGGRSDVTFGVEVYCKQNCCRLNMKKSKIELQPNCI